MGSRKYLVGMLFVGLLIWGPINHSWPAWFAIRICYLIGIPIVAWFLLKWFWGVWKPGPVTEERFERILGVVTAGVFLLLAVLEAVSDTHVGNTMWVRTRDGMEAVGDNIVLSGPDWGNVIVLIIAGGCAIWFSLAKRDPKH